MNDKDSKGKYFLIKMFCVNFDGPLVVGMLFDSLL